ncbi:MAG: type IX secretion system sortase PorU [Muribaculaceae bacterium]|nr:type IX secretion system sortase PorU [Muribaculaceae bacterium]
MKLFHNNLRLWGIALVCGATALGAHAFSSSKYATTSRLAEGRWVKISIPADGVYEITAEELAQMGFSDVNNVKVYGNGGHMISEKLDGTAIDDLKPVNSAVLNGKLCFYGKGPVNMQFASSLKFSRVINAYSTHGYYFLTEEGEQQTVKTLPSSQQTGGNNYVTTCYDYCYHEQELHSFGQSGKDLFGEDITNGGTFDFTLPQVSDNDLLVSLSVGAKVMTAVANLNAKLSVGSNTVSLPFTSTSTTIALPTKSYNYYNACSPSASITTSQLPSSGKLQLSFTTSGSVLQGNLDNFIISYKRHNVIDSSEPAQMRMYFKEIADSDVVVLPGATASTVVWNVTNPNAPVNYELTAAEDCLAFGPTPSANVSQWMVFDPQQQLRKIDGYEPVNNQNLHALETPDMLIITNKTFMPQAQRIIDMHKQVDNLKIIAVDQEEIFNEFSSGTPDAMAYRLMCKMFYDRNSTRFKYLLLLGEGSYDNRGLTTEKKNRIITYQTDVSNHEDYSYTCDDFFGFMDDNSGERVGATVLRLGVGRIPSATPAEAKSDVDKLIKYVLAPDYGPWRNNAFFGAETGDDNLHVGQCETNLKLISETLNTNFEINKVYIDMYPRAVNEGAIYKETERTSAEAHRHLMNLLHQGQFYGTYVGHAGYRNLTHSRLWTATDAANEAYPHLPIFMSACCDVARYDSDQRGICEHMFHNPNGGAIALLTSTREVYANNNELLNTAWVKNLFNWNTTGTIPTLGQAYMKAKQSFGSVNQPNKNKFTLLGDPAMQVAYPVPLFQVTEVNGIDVTADGNVTAAPLQQVKVTAHVLNEDRKTVNTSFNGDATLTIYDKEMLFNTVLYNRVNTDVYFPRDILTQVSGRVVNGIFTGTAVLPRYCRAVNENVQIKVYAHKDGTDKMVNGTFNGLVVGQYNASTASDDTAPEITAMYLNEESSFSNGEVVPANSTVYIHATDDMAINNQSMTAGNNMRLVLDGGKKSFYTVSNSAVITDEGRTMDLAFQLDNLDEGEHSLSFTVHDAAGNASTRSISFVVGQPQAMTLSVEELPATTVATVNATTTLTAANVDLKVTDALGNLVWSSSNTSFPATWNLTDRNGNRVKGGVYKIFGTFTQGNSHGGTNVTSVIVVDPLK